MEFTKGSITVIDDIFTPQECQDIIKHYNNHLGDLIHRPDYRNLKFYEMVKHSDQKPTGDYEKAVSIKIMEWMRFQYRIQRAHIEKRHIGSSMNWHFDEAFDHTAFTSVTYLNDEYEGGHTIIRPHGDDSDKHNIEIIPRVGRTVFFHGAYHRHRVTPVKGGVRYTMPIWYMFMALDFPDKHKWWLN